MYPPFSEGRLGLCTRQCRYISMYIDVILHLTVATLGAFGVLARRSMRLNPVGGRRKNKANDF